MAAGIFPPSAAAQGLTDCLAPDVKHKKCGKQGGTSIEVQNICSRTIRAAYCVQRINGSWACASKTLKPNAEGSTFACDTNGRYKYRACAEGTSCAY